jgi:hypothetical protein
MIESYRGVKQFKDKSYPDITVENNISLSSNENII